MFCSLNCFFSFVLAAPSLSDLTLTSTAGRSDRRRTEHSRLPGGAKPRKGMAQCAKPHEVGHMIPWHLYHQG